MVENNYRTEGSSNAGGQSSSYMSVAAKAGEMQIFSSDILSQVNGLQRRQNAAQKMVRQGAKYSSHTNDQRLNHIQEQINNVEEKMLQIDVQGIKPSMSTQERTTGQHMLATLPNQSNDRLQSLGGSQSLQQRDSLPPGKPKLATLQNHQRLHPSQTFGEYVATNGNGKSRMTIHNVNSNNSGNNPLIALNAIRKLGSQDANTTAGLSSNGHMSNSLPAIEGGLPASSYSGKGGSRINGSRVETAQNSPMIGGHISEKQLQIEVQSSQQQRRVGLDANVDSTFTPTMMRRSIGSRSAAKQNERVSFLDKAAAHQYQTNNNMNNQIAAQASFDVNGAAATLPSGPPPNLPATVAQKIKQANSNSQVVQQNQLFQNRYTNGNEPNMLPKMAGISLERKNNQSKQKNGSLPPTGSLSLIQQNHLRRRHGDGSFGGNVGGSRMDFGISGESLQIKLTGTSLMNRNQQRDSYSQQMTKDAVDASMTIPPVLGNQPPAQGLYHPKMRARIPELIPQQFNSQVGQPGLQGGQTQYTSHMAEMQQQMNSPRNGNQIFQDNVTHQRVYSYHYIYDYLFVQVTEEQYEREYSRRIRTFQRSVSDQEETPERLTINSGGGDPSNLTSPHLNALQIVDPQADSSPKARLRGPELNRNQVFFSPQAKDSQINLMDAAKQSTEEQDQSNRFRQSQTENMNDNDYSFRGPASNPQTLDSAEYNVGNARKQVIKMRSKYNIRNALEKALQSTQFEGLKILTRDTILKASKTLELREKKEENLSQIVPPLKLSSNPAGGSEFEQQRESDDANVSKFMVELGSWLQEQNQRFKVTVKKKYINDILMQSKGAQNLAQNVVMVVTNNTQLSMNSPQKKKRVKRNLSVEASSGEDESAVLPRHEGEQTQMRIHGQATPQAISKAKAHQIGRRGYESENEARSLNSTTTSSTFPNLKSGSYANKQQNTPRQPRKMSTRSLSHIPNTVRVQRKVTEDINGNGAAATGGVGGDDQMNQLNVRYPPTKIKIVQNVDKYAGHMDHPINKMLSDYNEFTRLVFRTRVTESRAVQNIPYAIKLGKRLGMQLTKNQLMPATLKVRENSNAIKEKLVFHICRVIQLENEFQPSMDETCQIFKKQISEHTVRFQEQISESIAAQEAQKTALQQYRCFVGKGNNQMMVRSLFKNRFWWLFQEKEEPEKINLFWTQLRKLSIMNSLTCKFVNPKDKNQQKQLNAPNSSAPGQGLGLTIAQNSALMTPGGSTKFKKRKVSSAQSKSPDHALSTKEKVAAATAASLDPTTAAQVQANNVAMTLVGVKRSSDQNVTAAEERKADIAPVTAAPPQERPLMQSPAPATKEESKKEAAAAAAATNSNARAKPFETYPVKLANKIEDNYHLCNKKALLVNMKNYYEAIGEDPFDTLPVTFHVKEGLEDPNFIAFKQYYDDHRDEKNIWITKPGECTNQGKGIQVAKEWHELVSIIQESTRSAKRTCIVQKYIHNPYLIHRRKFDIRTYAMATNINGNYKAYYYQEGYLRTACREFTLHNLSNRIVHLTNDAVQKKAEDYGKFEPGNKLSYIEFQNYVDKTNPNLNVCFERDILPQIKKLTTDCFRATWGKMDPYKRYNTFECFGLDFMIDEQFKVYLIEVNTNPCLELSSPLLARLIPSMVENSLRLAVDPLFPPPEHFSQRKTVVNELCPENKFELIFDEKIDGPELTEIFKTKENIIIEIDEEELSDADPEAVQGEAHD